MINDLQLRLTPEIAYTPQALTRTLATRLGVKATDIKGYRIVKRSIDARQRQVMVNLTVKVFVNEPVDMTPSYPLVNYPDVSGARQIIVVGAGPA